MRRGVTLRFRKEGRCELRRDDGGGRGERWLIDYTNDTHNVAVALSDLLNPIKTFFRYNHEKHEIFGDYTGEKIFQINRLVQI